VQNVQPHVPTWRNCTSPVHSPMSVCTHPFSYTVLQAHLTQQQNRHNCMQTFLLRTAALPPSKHVTVRAVPQHYEAIQGADRDPGPLLRVNLIHKITFACEQLAMSMETTRAENLE
jgi:hypothetical protein